MRCFHSTTGHDSSSLENNRDMYTFDIMKLFNTEAHISTDVVRGGTFFSPKPGLDMFSLVSQDCKQLSGLINYIRRQAWCFTNTGWNVHVVLFGKGIQCCRCTQIINSHQVHAYRRFKSSICLLYLLLVCVMTK